MQPEQDTPPPIATLPGVESVNSVYSYGRDCGEEDGTEHLAQKGETLDGAMGWEDEAVDG